MKKFLFQFVLLAAFVLVPFSLAAQNISISGKVTEAATGDPLPGAAVMVKGTTRGVLTDMNGSYQIMVSEGEVLVCSYFGYKDVEEVVGISSVINFVLADDTTTLEDAVVVGYGTMKKTQLVGAVESLSGEALEDRVQPNLTRALQGQIPGLNIYQVDGKPNHQGSIYVRGNSTSYNSRTSTTSATGSSHSIGQGGSALILIDGVEGDLATVNPDDVASVSVLKDAASAAVYGARGAYGVILITTKNPSTDQIRVNYSSSLSINRRTVLWEDGIVSDGLTWTENFLAFYQGTARTPTSSGNYPSTIANRPNSFSSTYLEELRERAAAGYTNVYGSASDGSYMYYGSTNWIELFYRDYSTAQTHSLSISGSSDRVAFSISGRYYGQGSVYNVGEEDFDTYYLRTKGSIKVAKWLTLENNTSLSYRNYHQPVNNGLSNLLQMIERYGQPVNMPYNEDGTTTYSGLATGYVVMAENLGYQDDTNIDVASTTSVIFEPIKDVLKVSADFTYKIIRRNLYRAIDYLTYYTAPGVVQNLNSNSYKSDWKYHTDYITSNVVLTWTPKINENHDLNVTAGWNIEDKLYRRQYTNRNGLISFNVPSFSLAVGDSYNIDEDSSYATGLVGFFARANYTFFKRYIVEFAARYDGSSLFPSYNMWGFFPSASVGWRISEEPWMDWSRTHLDNLKIRVNAGSLGNAQISAYQFVETMTAGKTSILIDGDYGNYVTAPTPRYSNLTWETITTYDIGLDMDLLNSRLSFSGDYYWRYTDDMYCGAPELPNIFGASTPSGNFGGMVTKGWELTLGWRDGFNLAGKRMTYGIKASLWDSRSWITEYNNTNGNIFTYYVGKELGEIWGFRTDGYFLSNEEASNWVDDTFFKNGDNFDLYAGDLKFLDLNGDGVVDAGAGTLDDHGDLTVIGNQLPRFLYGINLDFKWNNIGLSLFIQGVGKRDWYPDVESGFFWGMYNRPYGYLMKNQIGDNVVYIDYSTTDWVVENADANPYWTRQVGYASNRNVGPLTWENDYYLQDASYVRLKNLTIDYTFPKEWTRKINIEALRIYFAAENLLTYSPMFKYTKMFDPEVISNGDSDFSTTSGLSGVGQGFSYPMLKTFTFGINLTF